MISIDFNFIMKLVVCILLPIIAVVVIGFFLMRSYSKKLGDENTDFYNYTMDYCASLLAMVIVGILLAVVAGFSISFTHTMRIKDIVIGNEIIYYFLMFIPIIPFIFLLYYIRKFIVAASGRRRSISSSPAELQH